MLVYDSNRTVPAIVHAVPLGLRICSCHALHAVPETLEDTMLRVRIELRSVVNLVIQTVSNHMMRIGRCL